MASSIPMSSRECLKDAPCKFGTWLSKQKSRSGFAAALLFLEELFTFG